MAELLIVFLASIAAGLLSLSVALFLLEVNDFHPS